VLLHAGVPALAGDRVVVEEMFEGSQVEDAEDETGGCASDVRDDEVHTASG